MSRFDIATYEEAEGLRDRVIKTLAEVGYVEGEHMRMIVERVGGRFGVFYYPLPGAPEPPFDVRWRARETANPGNPMCFRHYGEVDFADCVAAVPFLKDCRA
jgi:hypothetical protein